MNREELVHLLAKKAKELQQGMRQRVQRDPDVADYLACFIKAVMEAEPQTTDKDASDPPKVSPSP